jgi:monoamine oxidase
MTDVVVIGAGVAGLAAAHALRAAGRDVIVLEASSRIGGRAWTTHPAELGGDPFDHGAAWLHAADHNKLVPIARAAGETLFDSDAARQERVWTGPGFATETEAAALDRAWDSYDRKGAELAHGPDRPLAAIADALGDDPWAATIEAWQGPVIDAAEPSDISLADWHANELAGGNLMIPDGLGTFVARRLGPLAGDVRCGIAATHLAWDGAGVRVETTSGTLDAGAAIVTVSTAVLAAGAIRFTPGLPDGTAQAIENLPLGCAVKVALRASGADRLGLPPHTALQRRLARRGDPFMVFNAWPFGRDHVIGWIGGDAGRALVREGAAAAEAFARAHLREMFGAAADRAFAPGALVTGWDRDRFIGGAYSNARPGHAAARAALAAPLADGRLIFAGEATHVGMAGTVGGAWETGLRAAQQVHAALPT